MSTTSASGSVALEDDEHVAQASGDVQTAVAIEAESRRDSRTAASRTP
jgi:hypothetical protein